LAGVLCETGGEKKASYKKPGIRCYHRQVPVKIIETIIAFALARFGNVQGVPLSILWL